MINSDYCHAFNRLFYEIALVFKHMESYVSLIFICMCVEFIPWEEMM